MENFDIAKNWWQLILIAILCYFVGCFNFARLISRSKKKDITKIGSGNPGTMNMTREFGLKIGLITFLLDACKGGVPAVIFFNVYKNYVFSGGVLVGDFIRYFCGVCVIIGHIFPVTTGFKGGKGIASTLGLFWFCLPCDWGWWALIVFALLVGVVLFIVWTEWGSLGSLLGVSGLSVVQMAIFVLRYQNLPLNAYLVCLYMLILVINLLTWIAHKENLMRLFAGEEHHTSIKKMAKKKSGEKEKNK